MPIPKYHELMLPLLKLYSDKIAHHRYDFVENISNQFALTSEEKGETVSNGRRTRVEDRTCWALTFLKKAKLLDSPSKGYYIINQRGLDTLNLGLQSLTPQQLIKLYPDILEDPFYNPDLREVKTSINSEIIKELTPDETLEQVLSEIKSQIISDILDNLNKVTPRQFENLVVKLLVAMGYGTEEFSITTSYVNDGGIDGIIQADELGFEKIYVQAKKYQGSVGRPDMQKFVGAMTGTSKGVFITTSSFAPSVHEYLKSRQENITLINGQELVKLMYKYNQGVTVRKILEIKTIDTDYFEEL